MIKKEPFQVKSASSKDGMAIFKNSIQQIKSDSAYFMTHVFILGVVFLMLQMTILYTGNTDTIGFVANLVYYFFNFLLIPSYLVQSLKYREQDLGFKYLFNEAISKISSFKIYFIFSICFIVTALSFLITVYPILDATDGHSMTTIMNTLYAITEFQNDPSSLTLFIENNPESSRLIESLGNLNQSLFITCIIIGGLFFAFSMVTLFYVFFAALYFDHINLKDCFKISYSLNFKNAGFFFCGTLGIVIVLFFSSILSTIPVVNYLIKAFLSIYIYFIFVEISKYLTEK